MLSFTFATGVIIVSFVSGYLGGVAVINKTIPKNKSPELDRDMEKLLEDYGYVKLKDYRREVK